MQENINIPDSTITTNLSFRNLVLMNMQQLTNFPYIEKDFDALTDYELLCLVVKFLNDVIANQNEQNDSITRMYESFLALQTYVNNTKDTLEDAFNELDDYVRNYFDNLDVQEEINNKLDEMLEDGVLEQIIEQFIQTNALWCFDTVADMKLATNLINGSCTKTLGFYSVNDGGMSTYKIRTKGENEIPNEKNIISLYDTTLVAELVVKDYATAEQFGSYGDDTHDDTLAIQSLLDYCKTNSLNANLSKNYLITSPINISGQYILINGEKSSITYNGNDSAIKINGCIDSTIYLGEIFAESGNGIEFYTKDTSSQSTSGWCQYVNLSFVLIRALDKCIYFNRSSSNNGWINEIRISKGKLERGNYGIYADSKDINAINNISISNVGIEGVTTGIYLANKCFMWNFNNCRYAEAFTTLIETVGDIRQCVFNGSVLFPINKCNMSTSTSNFIINAPIGDTGSRVIAYNGCFYEGSFRPQIKNLEALNLNRTIYSDTVNYVMTEETYTDYIIIGNNNTNLESIKLNKSFPTSQWGDLNFAINEFILAMNFTTAQSLIIYDANDNIVFNQGHNYTKAYLKFKFTTNVGWICEEMNVVPTI